MFRKVLIANRGEIALRIIRTCKRLKVKTVAVYSEADLESKHVVQADEAYSIGGPEPLQSYLNIPNIIKAARKSGAEAIHPGYGFLAENPELAQTCEDAGLVFIGPRSKILAKVANKLESKQHAAESGIPVIPGARTEILQLEEAREEAQEIGFPVLVKAVHGGGGRGMRVVRNSKELARALQMARVEAEASFGHPELYMEKYLENPHHIEVQILAGPRGRIIHLGERECSLQRRYQKILEETPSPVLDEKQRRQVSSLGLRVAKATHYENAGTVEFVMSQQGDFYYMETNKRIQVEHLISEMVTGIDIVEQQLTMASERRLDLAQSEIRFSGAAINCRINAEDPARGFVPSPGRVKQFVAPGGPGIRVDTALFDGAPIPEYYDSLIAKVASQGRDRTEAIDRMRVALDELMVEGVKTTIAFHLMILDERRFQEGDYHTQLLDRIVSDWVPETTVSPEQVASIHLALEQATRKSRALKPRGTDRTSSWKSDLWNESQQQTRRGLYVEGL